MVLAHHRFFIAGTHRVDDERRLKAIVGASGHVVKQDIPSNKYKEDTQEETHEHHSSTVAMVMRMSLLEPP